MDCKCEKRLNNTKARNLSRKKCDEFLYHFQFHATFSSNLETIKRTNSAMWHSSSEHAGVLNILTGQNRSEVSSALHQLEMDMSESTL